MEINMENIKLWEKDVPYFKEEYGQPAPTLTPFILPTEKDENGNDIKRGCVIVCPGGAYQFRADHEGAPVAELMNKNGISSFVLNYRLNPYYDEEILGDVKRAIRYVRYHADKFGIDPEKIAVLGFSAGGHLSTLAATHYDYGLEDGDEIDKVSCRPNASIPCYPLVTFDERYTYNGITKLFFGKTEGLGDLPDKYSGENCVRDDNPPMFMWHTSDDPAVPVENSLVMGMALSKKKIPFEVHVFDHGAHGLGLGEDVPGVKEWGRLAVDWLHRMGF